MLLAAVVAGGKLQPTFAIMQLLDRFGLSADLGGSAASNRQILSASVRTAHCRRPIEGCAAAVQLTNADVGERMNALYRLVLTRWNPKAMHVRI